MSDDHTINMNPEKDPPPTMAWNPTPAGDQEPEDFDPGKTIADGADRKSVM